MTTKTITLVELSSTLRERLQEYGSQYGSLSRLSYDVRIPQTTLHSIMCGRRTHPRPEIADKLCAHFGITIVAVEKEVA